MWGCWKAPLVEESLSTRIQRIQDLVRDLNRQMIYQQQVIQGHATAGLQFLEEGDEQRARAEAQMQLQAVQTRQVYVDLHTKFRMLLQEIERAQNLSICVDNFKLASGIMGDAPTSVQDVDKVMVKLEQQLEGARDVTKSLQRPIVIQNVRQVLTSGKMELPDLPTNLTRLKEDAPRMTMEL